MNPLTNVKNLNKINERELQLGITGDDGRSWHGKYKDSAWIFFGGAPFELTEGDLISVFSQYGELTNINLIRDKTTGKSRGFGFVCYEDQRSTVLAVDNFSGVKLLGRTLRVDHVEKYRIPKEHDDIDEKTLQLYTEGIAPKPIIQKIEKKPELTKAPVKSEPSSDDSASSEESDDERQKQRKKRKHRRQGSDAEKKKKKKDKKRNKKKKSKKSV